MKYLIWSFEHQQWWGPGRCGYTSHTTFAGRYDAVEAGQIVTDSIMGDEVAICEPVVERNGPPTVEGLWAK
jgi:hypothetical protein